MQDLEKLRDEKCAPITQAIMVEMGNELNTSQDDHNSLTMKTLSLMLSKDLNIETEVSYIPQLILKGLSELNATLQSCDAIEADDERYGLIANKMLTIISESKIDFINVDSKQFEPIKEKLNKLFSEEKLTKLELRYIKDMIFENFTAFNNKLQGSIEMATQKAETKALGIDSMSDLSLKRLDEFLKS
jgi:hypothetical protein